MSQPPLRRPTLAVVKSIREVAPRHFALVLNAPEVAESVNAGQFVHVLARDADNRDPLLRRAFSILTRFGCYIEILFRVEGRGTKWLSQVQVGETIDILGPLGKPFDLTPFHVKQSATPILVGGGVGVPPMVFLGSTLQGLTAEPLAIIGARSAGEVLCEDWFDALRIPCQTITDDGSKGRKGRVTDLLEEALQQNSDAVVYSCGPWPMLRAVAAVAAKYKVPCQVSMEENMPCGIGVCNGCVVATNAQNGDFERYRRVCIDGPALWASDVDWGNG